MHRLLPRTPEISDPCKLSNLIPMENLTLEDTKRRNWIVKLSRSSLLKIRVRETYEIQCKKLKFEVVSILKQSFDMIIVSAGHN